MDLIFTVGGYSELAATLNAFGVVPEEGVGKRIVRSRKLIGGCDDAIRSRPTFCAA